MSRLNTKNGDPCSRFGKTKVTEPTWESDRGTHSKAHKADVCNVSFNGPNKTKGASKPRKSVHDLKQRSAQASQIDQLFLKDFVDEIQKIEEVVHSSERYSDYGVHRGTVIKTTVTLKHRTRFLAGVASYGGEERSDLVTRCFTCTWSFILPFIFRQKKPDPTFLRSLLHSAISLYRNLLTLSIGLETYPNEGIELNEEQDVLKYHTNVWMCRGFRHVYDKVKRPKWATEQELSVIPSFLKRLVNRRIAQRDLSFLFSLQQCKVSWLRLSEKKFATEQKETIALLCDERKPTAPDIRRKVVSQLEKTTKMVFMDSIFEPTKMIPNTKASVLNSRQNGGTAALFEPLKLDLPDFGVVRREPKDPLGPHFPFWKDFDEFINLRETVTKALQERVKVTTIIDEFSRWRNRCFERATYYARQRFDISYGKSNLPPNTWIEDLIALDQDPVTNLLWKQIAEIEIFGGDLETVVALVDDLSKKIVRRREAASERSTARCGSEWNDVNLILLPEASKFRGITNGDGWLYTALQPLQGQMLSAWKATPYSTMTEHLEDRIVRLAENVEESRRLDVKRDWVWVSGDYSAATNKLHGWVPLAVIDTLANQPDAGSIFPNIDLAQLSFVDCRVFWTEESGLEVGETHWRRQQHGQLMGHPLSFPMLCVENLAVYRLMLKEALERGVIAEELYFSMLNNVIVNGDDIAFAIPMDVVPLFYEVSSWFGFEVSVGKNYVSSDILQINRRIFQFSGKSVSEIGYLNQKFLTGFDLKAGAGGSLASGTQIGPQINRMCTICPWSTTAIPSIMRRWTRDFEKTMLKPNWFLPVHLGGMGIDPKFADKKVRLTREQRILANIFIHDIRSQIWRLAQRKTTQLEEAIIDLEGKLELKRFRDLTTGDAACLGNHTLNESLLFATQVARASMSTEELKDLACGPEEGFSELYRLNLFRKWKHKLRPMTNRSVQEWSNAVLVFTPRIEFPSIPLQEPLSNFQEKIGDFKKAHNFEYRAGVLAKRALEDRKMFRDLWALNGLARLFDETRTTTKSSRR